jgi:hypothetical protein
MPNLLSTDVLTYPSTATMGCEKLWERGPDVRRFTPAS